MNGKIHLNLNPLDFEAYARKVSFWIKDQRDRRQFNNWVSLFLDQVTKEENSDDGSVRYLYPEYSPIIFDGMDGLVILTDDGFARLRKEHLLLVKEDTFPHALMLPVGDPEPSIIALLHQISNVYNYCDNRYRCMIDGKVYYKRHNGKWTIK